MLGALSRQVIAPGTGKTEVTLFENSYFKVPTSFMKTCAVLHAKE
jgi:hypothetical protein